MPRLPIATLALLALTSSVWAEENVAIPPTSTPEQIAAFKGADDNNDGALTPPEFRAFIEAMAKEGEPTAQFISTFGVHSVAFSKVDRDKDGYARPFEISNANQDFEKGDETFGNQADN